MKCTNCNEEFTKPYEIKMDLGIAVIYQKQCPKCQCPLHTDIQHKKDDSLNPS